MIEKIKIGNRNIVIRVKKMIVLGIQQFQDPYYQGVAAQLAFFMFLSILPTFILLSQVLGFFSLSLSSIENWVDINISGAGAMTGEGYVKDRIRSIKTILITVFTVAFALVALVYGPLLLKLIFGKVLGSEITEAAWMALRWPLAAAMYFLMISYNYYVLPSFKVRYRDIVPGSVFASAGFLVVTYVYNLYTQVSQNYNILYGSFSNIVVLMFWFWFVSLVMCLGVNFNRIWWATRKEGAVPIAPEAMAKRKPINIF